MEEILKSLSEDELYELIYTWWCYYRFSLITLDVDNEFRRLIPSYAKEILACAACMHKDQMPNDNLVAAISEGYAFRFLEGIKISIGLFFSSQEEFDEELRKLIAELKPLKDIRNYCGYVGYTAEDGERILN